MTGGDMTQAGSDEFVRRAVELADPNVLRIVLLQLTGNPRLRAMPLHRATGRAGALSVAALSEADAAEVQRLAAGFLLSGQPGAVTDVPGDGLLRQLMEIMTAETITDREFGYRREELSMSEVPFAASWSDGRPAAAGDYEVAVIGAGFSGIAVALQLQRLGIRYTIYERRHEIGGTWSINRYPDARVDSTSFIYQFNFEKNYPWSQYYAPRHEVREYLEFVARKHGVYDHIVLNADVTRGRFDEASSTWELHVARPGGAVQTETANFVITASGLFSSPRPLDIQGAGDYRGELIHSTQWRPDTDVAGQSVAIIGNGSSGVQILAPIAERARQVYVMQRTPQWIAPAEGYGAPVEPETRWLLDTLPYYWNWLCYSKLVPYLTMAGAQTADPHWQASGGLVSERNDATRAGLTQYLTAQVQGREDLVQRLVPDYPPLSRRLIIDNGWYRALLRDNVELVTEGIAAISPHGPILVSDRKLDVDIIVAAVGFVTTKYVWPAEYAGRGGQTLQARWDLESPRAHLGITVPGFPNFFMLYGPNSQTRASGLLSFVEQWARYAVLCIARVIESGGSTIEVTEKAFRDYNDALDAASEQVIWNLAPGGRNYYLNEQGRNQVSAPWVAADSYAMLLAPDPDHYVVR
jgi:4-hydroxyacetophenone monooxygenase